MPKKQKKEKPSAPRRSAPKAAARAPQLVVLSREDVEHYEPSTREICISICDPGAVPAGLSPSFQAVLRLQFDDVVERGDPADILFAEEHAREIVAFMERWADVDRVILHCNMGVSRSPGVALGLCDVRGWATAELERSHPGWNRLVRGVIAQSFANSQAKRIR
jgi:predicted protein tyrosine phosphatase